LQQFKGQSPANSKHALRHVDVVAWLSMLTMMWKFSAEPLQPRRA
jgi:hypothetical protein